MNGVHDMGGMHGFGPVTPEANEPPFHAEWEKRALAITLAMGATGQWNIDLSRAEREALPPVQYLGSSYYAIWIAALERLMLARGLVSAAELAGQAASSPGPALKVLRATQVDAALAAGSPADRPATAPARFSPGQRVRALNLHPAGHTRLPRYVRGHVGAIVSVHGAHLFADRHAAQPLPPFDQRPEWLYTVAFSARELWGQAGHARDSVSVEAWEPYLEPA